MMTRSDSQRSTQLGGWSLWVWLLLATSLAAGVRFYHLGHASFWIDELNTVASCARYAQAGEMPLQRCKTLGYVPTYFSLWAQDISPANLGPTQTEDWQAAGVSEIPVRLASVLLGVLTIPFIGLVGWRILGTRAAVFLMLLLAIAPWHLYWSQAGRFYSQQFLFFALCLFWYYSATKESSKRRLVASMVCLVLAFLTQPPALVVVVVFALDWIIAILRRRSVRLGGFGWLCAVVALALCVGSWWSNWSQAPDNWAQFGRLQHQSALTLILGVVYFVGPVTFVLAATGFVFEWQADRRKAIYFGLASGGVTVALALLSLRYYVALRYAFVALIGFLVLAAIATDKLYSAIRPKHGWLIALVPMTLALTSAAFMDYTYFTGGAGFHPRWREAFAYVSEHRKSGESVLAYPQIGKYYLQDADVHFLPGNRPALLALREPAWIVVRAAQPIQSEDRSWLADVADLRAYFDTRALQPFTSLQVYYYKPNGHRAP